MGAWHVMTIARDRNILYHTTALNIRHFWSKCCSPDYIIRESCVTLSVFNKLKEQTP